MSPRDSEKADSLNWKSMPVSIAPRYAIYVRCASKITGDNDGTYNHPQSQIERAHAAVSLWVSKSAVFSGLYTDIGAVGKATNPGWNKLLKHITSKGIR